MVLGCHFIGGWRIDPESAARFPRALRFILGHGWLGVDLFFVLSGFLITGILLDSREKPSYFRNFYARRFLRIVPLYFSVIIVMWLCYGGPTWYFILSFLFLANFSMAFNVSIPHGADVFWSLAVEEHFYLIWPWLVRFLTRRGLTIFACCVVVLVPCLRVWAAQLGVIPEKIYSYSYFRFDELALGALLAIWVRSAYARRFSSLKAAGLLLCACAVVTLVGLPFGIMERHSVLRYIQAELGFGSLVLGAFALQGSRFTAPLRWSFAKMSGDLSYCMYLIHLGLGDCFEHFRKLLGIDFGGSPAGLKVVFVRGAFMLFATLSLAWLSRRFLEGPMLRLKAHFEYEGSARQPAGAVTDGAAPR